jgi:hypothetical protein
LRAANLRTPGVTVEFAITFLLPVVFMLRKVP